MRPRSKLNRYDPMRFNSPGGVTITARVGGENVSIVGRAGDSFIWLGDVCDLSTKGLTPRAAKEVYSYAFLVNCWLATLRGQRVKVKPNRNHYQASRFTAEVRRLNPGVFPRGQTGRLAMVVGHVPDTALSGDPWPCFAGDSPCTETHVVPGWMPMTTSANNRVSKLTLDDSKFLREITINNETPVAVLI